MKQPAIDNSARVGRQQNRPYNSQNVFDNLHGAVPKASVQEPRWMLSAETEGIDALHRTPHLGTCVTPRY